MLKDRDGILIEIWHVTVQEKISIGMLSRLNLLQENERNTRKKNSELHNNFESWKKRQKTSTKLLKKFRKTKNKQSNNKQRIKNKE